MKLWGGVAKGVEGGSATSQTSPFAINLRKNKKRKKEGGRKGGGKLSDEYSGRICESTLRGKRQRTGEAT